MRNRYFEDEAYDVKVRYNKVGRVISYLGPYKKKLVLLGIFVVLMGFLVLVPPYLNSLIVDDVMVKQKPNYVAIAAFAISAWFLIHTSNVAFEYIRYNVMAKTAYSVVRDIRRELFYHLQTLSFDYYDNRPGGKILVRVTSYIDEISNVFHRSIFGILMDGIRLFLILVWMFILDYRFAVAAVAVLAPMAVILFFIQKILHHRYRELRNKISNRTAYIAENIQGIQVTKAFNRAALNTKIYSELNNETISRWYKVVHVQEFFWPIFDAFINLGVVGVYVLVFILAQKPDINMPVSLGKLLSFIMYLSMFAAPLVNISAYLQEIGSANSNLERIFETMDTPPSVYDCADAYDLPQVAGHVEFDDVTFGYEKDRIILEHFCLDVPAGKTIALVGPTGAGKSTVVNLLSRFYEAGENKIRIDGHDISKVKLHSLRAQVGVMMQDPFLFSASVTDNIRYARPGASDEDCVNAAEKAGCDEFIRKLPQGYGTVLAEKAAGLSAGEIQLLSLARIILTDPRILILDEATSSIDTETEAKIQSALAEVIKGRTSFIVAHRLSTIKNADVIIVIHKGKIRETGRHDELIALGGIYKKLYDIQFL